MSEDYFNDAASAPPEQASDFFAGGSPSCRFNNIGDTHAGIVVSFEEAQQRNIKTGEPKFWPDGNKREMLVITLQTDERDDEIDDDDGKRRLYVNKPSGMFAAIRIAIGKNRLVAGAQLAVKYVKNGKAKQAGFNPPKEYAAKYVPPAGSQPAPTAQQAQPKANGPATLLANTTIILQARRQAFDEFKKLHPGATDAEITTPWRDLLDVTIPGKTPATFTAADWQRVRLAVTEVANPLTPAGTGIPEDDIPFTANKC